MLSKQYDIPCDLPSRIVTSVCLSIIDSQPQDSKLNDIVTITASVTDNKIVKAFYGPDHQPLKFSPGEKFQVTQHSIHDLQSLALVIGGLEAQPTKAVIRGLPLLPKNEPVARQSQNFSPISYHWCMIDLDSLPWDGDLQDQQAMLEYATSQLPEEFQQADCWYHFSSSMGIKPGIRVHLWYWLERPCSDAELNLLRLKSKGSVV